MGGHGHAHGHGHGHGGEGRALGTAFWLNFGFTLIELVGGVAFNSVAILSDAVHDLGDTLSIGLGWWLGRVSEKQANASYTYGFKRLSVLAAVINAMVLIAGSAFVVSEAVPRLFAPEMPNVPGMLGLAVLGVLVNGAGVLRLGRQTSLNSTMIRWHLLEDTLGWVAVLLVSLVLMIWPVPILDPILSIAFTSFIVFNVVRNLWAATKVFLQAAPAGVDIERLVGRLRALDAVRDVHHVHVWSLDGEQHVFSAHIELADERPVSHLRVLKGELQDAVGAFGFSYSTIEFEWPDERCRDASRAPADVRADST
ncbi:MAG: cation transporter [Sandaracinaceae bacterium]|nr:cation transporter [Sandaracinaceae bacterium]